MDRYLVRRWALVAAITIASSACTQLGKFVLGDLTNAAALANGGHDQIGAACWTALQAVAAPSPAPSSDGIAVVAERDRLLHGAIASDCGAVIAPVLLNKVVLIPF
jgi:hypothetical protein